MTADEALVVAAVVGLIGTVTAAIIGVITGRRSSRNGQNGASLHSTVPAKTFERLLDQNDAQTVKLEQQSQHLEELVELGAKSAKAQASQARATHRLARVLEKLTNPPRED